MDLGRRRCWVSSVAALVRLVKHNRLHLSEKTMLSCRVIEPLKTLISLVKAVRNKMPHLLFVAMMLVCVTPTYNALQNYRRVSKKKKNMICKHISALPQMQPVGDCP